jgi:FkbM family methyltransferase
MMPDWPHDSERLAIRKRLGPGFDHYHEDLDLLLKVKSNGLNAKVIFDIGASNTIWSVVAHTVFPSAQIEMFEPLAEVSDRYLHGKLTHPSVVNFLRTAKQRIHAVALGSRNGICSFHRMKDESASTSIATGNFATHSQVIPVPMHRLDDFVEKHKMPFPDIIKLDTQGSEGDILEGARLSLGHARAVFIESWFTKMYGQHTPLFLEMAHFLSQFGMQLADLGGEYRDNEGILHTKDALFFRPDRTEMPKQSAK